MELLKASVRTYGFTLRKTKLPAAQEDYIKHLARLSTIPGCNVESYVFEYEAGLHSHGIITIPAKTDFKRFRFRGWNIQLEELWDPQQWVIYMNKHQHDTLSDELDAEPDYETFDIQKLRKNTFFNNNPSKKICKHKLGDDFCDEFCNDFPCIPN